MSLAAKILYTLSVASMPSGPFNPSGIDFVDNTSNRKGGRKFTRKPSGSAQLKRASRTLRNIRRNSKK